MSALKKEGVFYGSWKYGDSDRVDEGRYFADYTEIAMMKLIKSVRNVELLKIWVTEDVRVEKKDNRWLNILVRKVGI